MAYNFKAIKKNFEYIEKEEEFDVKVSHNLTNMRIKEERDNQQKGTNKRDLIGLNKH